MSENAPFQGLSSLWKLTVDRPVATLMIVVAVSVFGYLSYGQLSLSLMPELSYPTLTVRTDYEGAAPEEIEEEITKPLEELLRTVEGLMLIESTSRAGLSDIVLQFHWDTDMDFASQRVRERSDLMSLPEGSEKPLLLRYDPSLDPILRIGLHSDKNTRLSTLRTFAEDEIARSLEKIKGIAMVRVRGGREDVVRIDLDQRRMSQLGLSVDEVQQRLAAENVNLAGGRLRQGEVEYLVRTLNEFQDLEQLKNMVITRRGDQNIRLNQVARIYFDYQDREVMTHIEGNESVEIAVYKEADANLVQVATEARERIFGSVEQLAYIKGLADGTIKPPGAEKPKPEEETKAEKDKDKEKKGKGKGKKEMDPKEMERRAKELNHTKMISFLGNTLPDGFKLDLLSDQSQFIERSIEEVISTALLGALFAILILYVFLRSPYSTLIIAVAIPLSVVFTFAPMRIMGLTLNIMSLGGLALGIGMLVDNSIVVLESIFRCRDEGDDIRTSAIRGTREVGSAVIASTLTTTAVFFPIVFIEGVAGQLFGDLALTVVFSLLASLIVALFVVPMLASREFNLGKTAAASKPTARRWLAFSSIQMVKSDTKRFVGWLRSRSTAVKVLLAPLAAVGMLYIILKFIVLLALELVFAKIIMGLAFVVLWVGIRAVVIIGIGLSYLIKPLLWLFDQGFGAIQKLYPKLLRGALNQRFIVLVSAITLFGGALGLMDRLGMELIPELHQGEFKIELRLPIGTNLDETAKVTKSFEVQLDEIEAIKTHSSVIGAEKTSTSEGDRGEHSATINVLLNVKPGVDIEEIEREVMTKTRAILSKQPGLQYELARPSLFTLQTPIRIEVRGYNLRQLRQTSEQIARVMQSMPELADVRSNLRSGFPEVQIAFSRDQLARYNLTVRQVAQVVQQKVRGATPSEFRRNEDRIDIIVRVEREQIQTVADLENLIIGYQNQGGQTTLIPLSQASAAMLPTNTVPIMLGAVANVQIEEGPSEIRHIDGQRAAVVDASSQDLDLQSTTARIQAELNDLTLPRGFSLGIGGQNRELEQARRSMLFALLLAVFLVYIVMASQFESILAPLVIIFTIPLALIGVAVALWLVQTPVSVVVFIGLIMLAGIVVNNAIVLVDYIIQLRARGRDATEAIVEACEIRLRPVLITTLTTVLGLIPMALGLGEGAEIRQPMALTVIAGLASSTLLTLVVIPVVFALVVRKPPKRIEEL